MDMAGRVVARLGGESTGPSRRFVWDGRNEAGQPVAPGVYIYRIDANADAGEATQVYTVSVAY